MKRKTQSKRTTSTGRGPLARKVITTARQHLQQKVASLADWKEAKLRSEEYQKTVISKEELTEYDPIHGLTNQGTTKVSCIATPMGRRAHICLARSIASPEQGL